MTRRALRTLGVAALSLALAACAGPGAEQPSGSVGATTTSAPAGDAEADLSAVAFRLREDEAVGGRFQVKVTNAGTRRVHVTSVALDSPALGAEPATPRSTDLRPGARVDLPVRYGPAVCDQSATDVTAVVTLDQDGAEREVRLPLATTEASVATLQRIHDESCTAQRIGEVVAPSLAPGTPTTDAQGAVLPATVVLDRLGEPQTTVTATRVGGSVLYGLEAQPGALPATLAADQARLQIPVLVRTTRCTGHVLGEVKKPYDLGVWLSLDGGPDQWTRVSTTPRTQAALRDHLARACDLG